MKINFDFKSILELLAQATTAIMATLSLLYTCCNNYRIRKQNKIILHMLLKNTYDDFCIKRRFLESIFAYDDPTKPLKSILEPYEKELNYNQEGISEVKFQEKECRKNLSEKEMDLICNYISALTYFYNLIRCTVAMPDKTKTLYEYKNDIKNTVTEKQCILFGVDSTQPFDIFYHNCFDKISEYWKKISIILK